MQQQRDITGLGAGELHQFVDIGRIGQPGFWVLAVLGVGVQGDFGEGGDNFRMLLGEVLAHDPGIEGWCAELGQFRGGDQHLAVFLGHAQGRVPDVRGIDVAALPGGDDGRWRQVEHGDFRRVDVPMLQRGEQAVVPGGHERHGDLLADQILRGINAGAITNHQGLGGADLGGDEEGFHRDLAGDCGRQWAGAEVADLHVARGDGADDIGAVVELAPVDLGLGGFFIGAIGLGDFGRVDGGLVSDGQVDRLGKKTRCGQGGGREKAKGETQRHGKSPQQAAGCSALEETK